MRELKELVMELVGRANYFITERSDREEIILKGDIILQYIDRMNDNLMSHIKVEEHENTKDLGGIDLVVNIPKKTLQHISTVRLLNLSVNRECALAETKKQLVYVFMKYLLEHRNRDKEIK